MTKRHFHSKRAAKRVQLYRKITDLYISMHSMSRKAAGSKAFNLVKDMTETKLDMWIRSLCPTG